MIKLPVLYEDEYLLIVDKPAGIVVHGGAGQAKGIGDRVKGIEPTLLTDWIREKRPAIVENFKDDIDSLYYRPGIVHRLDKDTSGLLIIAKTPKVKKVLQVLFKSREVTKKYVALVLGQPEPEEGSIETCITRDPQHRRQMAVSFVGKGKEAKTDYKTVNTWYYRSKGQLLPISLMSLTLHSGRMHQIRVHLKHKGWPVIGDQTYQTKLSRDVSKELDLERQFLHAERLIFQHPQLNQEIDVISLLPIELQRILDQLEETG